MKLKDVRPGDLVKVTNDGPFAWAKVIRHRVQNENHPNLKPYGVLTVLRPWMAADHPDGAERGYPYIGVEVFDLFNDSPLEYEVIQAKRNVIHTE